MTQPQADAECVGCGHMGVDHISLGGVITCRCGCQAWTPRRPEIVGYMAKCPAEDCDWVDVMYGNTATHRLSQEDRIAAHAKRIGNRHPYAEIRAIFTDGTVYNHVGRPYWELP